jgi:hypothetical protein
MKTSFVPAAKATSALLLLLETNAGFPCRALKNDCVPTCIANRHDRTKALMAAYSAAKGNSAGSCRNRQFADAVF